MIQSSIHAIKRLIVVRGIFRRLVFLWTISMLLILSGCWDLRYLDKLGVVLALGVDEDPTGKQKLQLTVQVVLPQNVAAESKGGIGGTAVTTFTESGDTMFEAIRKMTTKTSRRLFFSHTQMLIISDKMARKDIYPLIDLIERNPDIRTEISVVVARGGKASDLLQLTTQMESIPVNQMHEMIEVNQSSYATSYAVLVKDITRLLGRGKRQAVLPSMRIEGNKAEMHSNENVNNIPADAIPVLSTMAVFREGRLIGYLSPKESRGLSWLHDKVKSTVVKLPCPSTEGKLIVEIHESSTELKVKRGLDDTPMVQVKVNLVGGVQEIMCPGLEVREEKVLVEIGNLTSEVVKKEIESAISRIQTSMYSDAIGWGREIYLQKPKIWKKIESDWEAVFPEVKSEVICTTAITGSGVRSESIVR